MREHAGKMSGSYCSRRGIDANDPEPKSHRFGRPQIRLHRAERPSPCPVYRALNATGFWSRRKPRSRSPTAPRPPEVALLRHQRVRPSGTQSDEMRTSNKARVEGDRRRNVHSRSRTSAPLSRERAVFHGFSTGSKRKLLCCSAITCRIAGGKNLIKSGFSRIEKRCGRPLGEGRPRANPVWGRGGVGT